MKKILLLAFLLMSCNQRETHDIDVRAFSSAVLEVEQSATCTAAQIGVQVADQKLIGRVQVVNCDVDPSDLKDGWMTLNPIKLNWSLVVIMDSMLMDKAIEIQFDNTQKDAEGYNYTQAIFLVNELE